MVPGRASLASFGDGIQRACCASRRTCSWISKRSAIHVLAPRTRVDNPQLERDELFFESSSRSIFLFEHDLRGKRFRVCRGGENRYPLFPDHALGFRGSPRPFAINNDFRVSRPAFRRMAGFSCIAAVRPGPMGPIARASTGAACASGDQIGVLAACF